MDFSAESLKYLLLILVAFSSLLDVGFAVLNRRRWHTVLPAELNGIYTESSYQRAKQYSYSGFKVGLLQEAVMLAAYSLVIAFGWLGQAADFLAETRLSIPLQGLVLLALAGVANGLLSMPFDLHHTFIREKKFGFNRMTPRLYIIDRIKNLLLIVLIGGPLGWLALAMIEAIGPTFWIYMLFGALSLSLFISLFYVSWLLPIFNKLRPLDEGELKQAIEELAIKEKFPLSKILIIDGSKRSTRANAFFSGLGWKKSIVLYDTLLAQHSQDELLAILAHEIGHYKKRHIYKGMAAGMLSTALTLFILSRMAFSPLLSHALGAESYHLALNLIGFGIIYTPVSLFVSYLHNALSRKHEYEADQFGAACTSTEAMSAALRKLSTENLSNPHPHPWQVNLYFSHPTLLQRLTSLAQDKESKKC